MTSSPPPGTQARQRQVLLAAAALIVLAIIAYLAGGKRPEPHDDTVAELDPAKYQIRPDKPHVPGEDITFEHLGSDGDVPDSPEENKGDLASTTPPDPGVGNSPAPAPAPQPHDTPGHPSPDTNKTPGETVAQNPSAAAAPSTGAPPATTPPGANGTPQGTRTAGGTVAQNSSPAPSPAPAPSQGDRRTEAGAAHASTSTSAPGVGSAPSAAVRDPARPGQPSPVLPPHSLPPSSSPLGALPAASGTSVSGSVASRATPELRLKQPRHATSTVVAHTESIVTESQFASPPAPQGDPATAPIAAAPRPRGVKVTQAQAREFAAHATRTWQAANRIPATQHFRLPTREETRDTKIWRDDDTPAQPGERRPFGLVLVAQPPPAAPATSAGAAPQTALTPEGIPVRVLPEGESALKKHGPDKPLWKKPE